MKGTAFCYYHGRAKRPTRPARQVETMIELPSVLSPDGVAYSLDQVVHAVSSNRISNRRAAVLLMALQMSVSQQQSGAIGQTGPQDGDGLLDEFLNQLPTHRPPQEPSR
jgi:hypothetical protein